MEKLGFVILFVSIPGIIMETISLKSNIHQLVTPENTLDAEKKFREGTFKTHPIVHPPIKGMKIVTLKGIRVPDGFIGETPINLYFGSMKITNSIFDLEKGINLSYIFFHGCVDQNIPIILKLVGNRIFISASFSDYEKNEYVGKMDFNKWEIYKPNLTRWAESDTSLWVKDLSNHYILFMKFIDSRSLELDGYFCDGTNVLVWGLDIGCANIKTQRDKVLEGIRSIDKWIDQPREPDK